LLNPGRLKKEENQNKKPIFLIILAYKITVK